MSWKQIKTLALVFLIVLDAALAGLVRFRYRQKNYYDGEIVRNVTALLNESEIYLDTNVLSEKIVSYPVLAGSATEESYRTALGLMAGAEVKDTERGMECAGKTGVYRLDTGRLFSYEAYGFVPVSESQTVPVADAEAIGAEAAARLSAFILADDRSDASSGGKYAMGFVCRDIAYSVAGGYYIATMAQTAGGLVTDAVLRIRFRDDAILSVDGNLLPFSPSRSLKPGGKDLLTVLLNEKAYWDAGEDKRIRLIDGVEYAYAIYYDMKDSFYLTPVCLLCYEDGSVAEYDMMTGERQ